MIPLWPAASSEFCVQADSARCLSGFPWLSYYPIVALWVKAEAKTPRACSPNISVPGLLLHQHGHGVQHSFHQQSTSSRGPPTCVRSDHAGQDPGQWKIAGTCWNLIWLVVDLPLWKFMSQLGWFFPIYGKIKNVPDHQPVMSLHRIISQHLALMALN